MQKTGSTAWEMALPRIHKGVGKSANEGRSMKLELIAPNGLHFLDREDVVLLATGCLHHIVLVKFSPADPHLVVFTRIVDRVYAASSGGM